MEAGRGTRPAKPPLAALLAPLRSGCGAGPEEEDGDSSLTLVLPSPALPRLQGPGTGRGQGWMRPGRVDAHAARAG